MEISLSVVSAIYQWVSKLLFKKNFYLIQPFSFSFLFFDYIDRLDPLYSSALNEMATTTTEM